MVDGRRRGAARRSVLRRARRVGRLCRPLRPGLRTPAETAQLVIAVVGLIATVVMTFCVAQRRYLAAGALLLVAMGLYAAWGVVLDQATHGSYFWE
jgi:hypothetical protein